jgi:hypothetical protein
MQATQTPATVQHTTAQLAAAFRVILADPAVDPRRLERAAALVDLVERTARPNVWLVPSATDATKAYTVSGGLCGCADAQNRDARRCQHALAVLVVQHLERLDAEAHDPTPAIVVEAEDESIPYELTARATAALASIA